jgi:hypothetical protein
MMTETLSDKDCAVLYLGWRLQKPLACPACGAHVASRDDARVGWVDSRSFTCDGCGRTGSHLVPDRVQSVSREKPAEPSRSRA